MKKLLGYADEYIRQSNWMDLSMIKLCLGAMGVLIGIALPQKSRKRAVLISGIVFAVTYVPLMDKFWRIVNETKEEKEE